MKTSLIQLVLAFALVGAAGCGSGNTPTANAPASTGMAGVPVMSAEQLSKLPPDKRERIEQAQAALQRAAQTNMERKQNHGRMPGG